MVDNIQHTSINRVLDDLMVHPLMQDLTLEQVVRHAVRFISLNGFPQLYEDRIENVEIEDFRGLLPCDFVRIVQVKDLKTGLCLRSMTDNFPKGLSPNEPPPRPSYKDLMNNAREERDKKGLNKPKFPGDWYIPHAHLYKEEPAFKTQGRVIYVTFPIGIVEVAYKAVPVDKDGFPLLVDDEIYIDALEAYIKKQVFTVKFDTGKIAANVLQNAQQDYAWAAARLNSAFTIPSVSEMETLMHIWTRMIHSPHQFINGFRNLGDKEFIRRH